MHIHLYIYFLVLLFSCVQARHISLMIDPAGDAQYTGRIIDDSLERGLTLQFAEKLKYILENHYPFLRVILTRFSEETLEPLQNAVFANRLNIDFYISIHFYYQPEGISQVYIYQFLYNPIHDFGYKPSRVLSWQSYNFAYLPTIQYSKQLGLLFKKALSASSTHYNYAVRDFFGLPFKPLIGIQAPALALEIGLKNKDDWLRFIDPCLTSLDPLLITLEKTVCLPNG